MNILCHVGPWCIQQYTAIAKAVDPEARVVLASGYLEVDETGLASDYYENLKNQSEIDESFDSEDFIKRCRVLRSLDYDEALKHLHAMKKAVSKMLDEQNPDLVISVVVDQYLIDLIRYESRLRGIPFFGLVVSFLNGYFRITGRGEYSFFRNANESEVDQVIAQLENNAYVPKFVSGSERKGMPYYLISKRLFANWARIPYFFYKRYISGEKYNYHYWASQKSAMENFHIIPRFWLGNKKWRKRIEEIALPVIYIPLQMYPEATIEYWCKSLDVIQYHKKLIEIIGAMSLEFQFVIKEHPNVLGLRAPSVYHELSNLENVTLLPLRENSNEIIEISDAVMVWTGTVGFEAALRGKPVLTVCKPYYVSGKQFKMVSADTLSQEIKKFIKENSGGVSYEEKKELVSHLLSGLVPGNFANNASWSGSDDHDIQDAKDIGAAIKLEFERGLSQ